MKKSIYCFLFLLLVAACGKKTDVVTPTPLYPHINPDSLPGAIRHPWLPSTPPPRPMIKSITYTGALGDARREYYYYNDQWQVIRIDYPDATWAHIDSFYWSPTYVTSNGSGCWPLNAQGLAYQECSGGSWYSQRFYSYNANKNMTNEHSMSGSADYYYNSSFNKDSTLSRNEVGTTGNVYYENHYTYNTHPNTAGNYNKGMYYFGKSSVNLVEREEYTMHYLTYEPTDITNINLYHYTYNSSDWVTHVDINSSQINMHQIDSVTVTYDTTWVPSTIDYTYY